MGGGDSSNQTTSSSTCLAYFAKACAVELAVRLTQLKEQVCRVKTIQPMS